MTAIIKTHKYKIKSMMDLCETKHWEDYVRILDMSEVMGTKWGAACTMQVMDYGTGDWIDFALDGKHVNTMLKLTKFIRTDLAYQGAIRLAIAAK